MSRLTVGETGVGKMEIGEKGVGEMGPIIDVRVGLV